MTYRNPNTIVSSRQAFVSPHHAGYAIRVLLLIIGFVAALGISPTNAVSVQAASLGGSHVAAQVGTTIFVECEPAGTWVGNSQGHQYVLTVKVTCRKPPVITPYYNFPPAPSGDPSFPPNGQHVPPGQVQSPFRQGPIRYSVDLSETFGGAYYDSGEVSASYDLASSRLTATINRPPFILYISAQEFNRSQLHMVTRMTLAEDINHTIGTMDVWLRR